VLGEMSTLMDPLPGTFARWAEGYGAIRHSSSTQARVNSLLTARPA
jgi:hypothetical protein